MAALSALAEKPGRLEKIFLNHSNSLSQNGIYAVNMYTMGLPLTMVVDDWLPLKERTDAKTGAVNYTTVFTHLGDDSSIWGPIMEKVFAKYTGNYSHIEAGDTRRAFNFLYDSPG